MLAISRLVELAVYLFSTEEGSLLYIGLEMQNIICESLPEIKVYVYFLDEQTIVALFRSVSNIYK